MNRIIYLSLLLIAALCAAPALAGQYKIDKAHSSAVFRINHLGASYVYGMIPDMEGTVNFDKASPEKSSIQVKLMPESLSTFEPRRDTHLKSPDFFNVKQFPAIEFKSTAWKKVDDNTFEVTGDLTMLGKTNPVTVTVEHVGYGKNPQGQELTGFETEFVIDRTKWGMNYGVAEKGGLGKDVTIIFAIEAGAA